MRDRGVALLFVYDDTNGTGIVVYDIAIYACSVKLVSLVRRT